MLKKIFFALLLIVSVSWGQTTYWDAVPVLDSVTTATGDSISGSLNTKGWEIFALKVPSTFDGDSVTIQTSHDGTTWEDPRNTDREILKFAAEPGDFIYFEPIQLYWLLAYARIYSNDPATGADKWYLYKGKYFKN